MSKTELDFDSVESCNDLDTVGWADVESFNGQGYTLEYIQEAVEEIRPKGNVKNVEVDLVGGGEDKSPVLAIKPKNRSKAVIVAPRVSTGGIDGGNGIDEPQPSDIPKGKKSDVNKRLVHAEKMRRGTNTSSSMDQYLAGYIDAHYEFKDELETMESTLEVHDE